NATADMDCTDRTTNTGCKMDGFVGQAEAGSNCGTNPTNPQCSPCTGATAGACNDAMGYHDAAEIPNYWTYAHDFVLQDHMFEPAQGWSLVSHLYTVSAWSAQCSDGRNPFTCVADNRFPEYPQFSRLPAAAQNVEVEDLAGGAS